MKHLRLLLPLLILCISCEDDDSIIFEPEIGLERTVVDYTSIRFKQTGVDSFSFDQRYSRVVSFSSFLLEAREYMDPYPRSVDDEAVHVLVMPMRYNRSGSFTYTDTELAAHGFFLTYERCYCLEGVANPVTEGSITGRRLSGNRWKLRGSIGSLKENGPGYPWDISGVYR